MTDALVLVLMANRESMFAFEANIGSESRIHSSESFCGGQRHLVVAFARVQYIFFVYRL